MSETQTLSLEFELKHSPQKVWRAITERELLSQWLLPVLEGYRLERDAPFTLKTEPVQGWDGEVSCRFLEIAPMRELRFAWEVPGISTTVTLTLTPTSYGTRLDVTQSGFAPTQKREFGGARYGWNMMSERLQALLDTLDEGGAP